ncbi:hypothetical protein GXW83_06225 [Streptacidiphilus sp. PB12-B1b]|uniref:lytic transglycosylase domain-containing protein n=1 Tax=Streptacidiphilus sp. PB12-B1b TaxID=2705012 RepID=UPI0015F84570|nr:lytic murein transglycosylase [Streptacidiphilus sp. PB12-B1b]QMU75405.1 hypothetical protein GXW83_06225 [Streptacidiphilus sp. PB12-B1b]
MNEPQRPMAATRIGLAVVAGALLAALLGAAQSPQARALPAAAPGFAGVSTLAAVSASDAVPGAAPDSAPGAVSGPVSVDAMSAAAAQTPYLQGLFGRTPSQDEIASGQAREDLPAFGAEPLAVNGVGTVYVPADGIGMVPDGDSADIQAGLSSSNAAYAPVDLQMPPSSGTPQLPHTVYLAYLAAESRERRHRPGCHLDWPMLAGIGQIESSQAYAGRVLSDGTSYPAIYGPTLNGSNGYMVVRDTDHGRLDGDRVWDRAVGPMQFMPTTWEEWGADGNGDGRADPQNIYDAALTTARYLCADGRDLSVPGEYDDAVLTYNDDQNYVTAVRAWAAYYRQGASGQFRPRPHRHPRPQPRPPVTPPNPNPSSAPEVPTSPVVPIVPVPATPSAASSGPTSSQPSAPGPSGSQEPASARPGSPRPAWPLPFKP